MCFDVPKVVRSPGYDHGHDEESRNGRDIKIDILDDYVWTSEGFRASSDKYRSTGGAYWALVGLRGERGQQPRCPNWTSGGGAAPLSLTLSLSFLPPSHFLVGLGEERKGEREKESGAPPPSPSPIRTRGEGKRGLS